MHKSEILCPESRSLQLVSDSAGIWTLDRLTPKPLYLISASFCCTFPLDEKILEL